MSFARSMGKNISKNLGNKWNQKIFDNAKQFATDELKTASKRAIKKQQKQLVV